MTVTLLHPDPLSPLELAQLRPEFALVLAAARVQLGNAPTSALEAPLAQVRDWQLLLKCANWHRLKGVIAKVMRQQAPDRIPAEVRAALEADYRQNAGRNLQLTALLFKLTELLKQAEIPALVIKGLALAGPLYGDLALRRSSDLDLLIDPRHVARAMLLICALEGCTTAPLEPFALKVLMGTDSEMKLEINGILVELQWRLAPLERFYPVPWQQLEDESESFVMAGRELATLGSLEMLPYLCFHGTKHRWYRMFWLLDVAAWLKANPDAPWQVILERAQKRCNARALLLGLALSRHLFASELPADLLAHLAQDTEIMARVNHLQKQLLPGAKTPYAPEVSDWVWWKNIYWMYPEWGHRAVITWRYLCQPTLKDLNLIRLPALLRPLYYVVHPLRLGLAALRMIFPKSERP